MYTIHYSGFIFKKISNTETISFPAEESNDLYQEYLNWVKEGNVADYFASPEELMREK